MFEDKFKAAALALRALKMYCEDNGIPFNAQRAIDALDETPGFHDGMRHDARRRQLRRNDPRFDVFRVLRSADGNSFRVVRP